MPASPAASLDDVVVEVRGLTKIYGGVHALDDVSLRLTPGHVHCLAGENGSGKSTLIKLISGAEVPDAGEIVIDGVVHARITPGEAIRAGIQVIYQDFSLFPNLTARENIVLTSQVARRAKLFSTKRTRPLADGIVRDLGLHLDLDSDVELLSVADRQLVAICRALVNDARVIIMDEPTTALTHSEVTRLFVLVDRLRERGVALMFVSHKLQEVLEVSQHVTVLRSGRAVAEGPASEFDRRRLTEEMTGHDIDESRRVTTPEPQEQPLLDVRDLGLPGAFEHISFSLLRGEILGITGLLGSGRSEIAEALFGVLPARTGTVVVDGRAVRLRSIADAVRAGIGYVPEDRLTQGLFAERSIADNIIAGSYGRYRVAGILIHTGRIRAAVQSMFERLRIKAPNVAAPVRSLSGGNAQRVVLARWLVTRPDILMLNGPTVGVDVGSKEEILELLRVEAARGMGIIVVSDDVPELVSVCNRILVVRGGEIAGQFGGDDVSATEIQERMAA